MGVTVEMGVLAIELPQEFLLVHAVFESFAAVDENHRHFVVELTAQVGIAVHINLMPGKTAATREVGESLLDDLTEMAVLAGVQDDVAGLRHVRKILARLSPVLSFRAEQNYAILPAIQRTRGTCFCYPGQG